MSSGQNECKFDGQSFPDNLPQLSVSLLAQFRPNSILNLQIDPIFHFIIYINFEIFSCRTCTVAILLLVLMQFITVAFSSHRVHQSIEYNNKMEYYFMKHVLFQNIHLERNEDSEGK